MALKLELKNIPSWAKAIISVVPSIILAAVVIFVFVIPKQKMIKEFDAKIDKQNNEIAVSQAKAAKLEVLKQENERLIARINELKEQLPEEKEISGLLKQVSDLSIGAGLEVKSWKPQTKVAHPSGIVEEIPVQLDVSGSYHNFGNFLSSLTRLNRIVNIGNLKLAPMGTPKASKDVTLNISFKASTFSAVPEQAAGQVKK